MSHGRIIKTDRTLHVPVGDGAVVTLPRRDWLYNLAQGKDQSPPGHCDDRRVVVGVLETLLHLISLPKNEAWRRILIMREAYIQDAEEASDAQNISKLIEENTLLNDALGKATGQIIEFAEALNEAHDALEMVRDANRSDPHIPATARASIEAAHARTKKVQTT
jgi:hypothetical protein